MADGVGTRPFRAVDPPEQIRLRMGLIQERLKDEIRGAIC
jgi:hypothetical protein